MCAIIILTADLNYKHKKGFKKQVMKAIRLLCHGNTLSVCKCGFAGWHAPAIGYFEVKISERYGTYARVAVLQ